MPTKQKNSKKQRAPRVVSNPKVVHRTGGRKPQPRVITAEKRIAGIRVALLNEMEWFLGTKDLTVDSDSSIETYVYCLIGIDGDSDELELAEKVIKGWNKPKLLENLHEAFAFAYKRVPDAEFIDVPGRHRDFFGPLMAKK